LCSEFFAKIMSEINVNLKNVVSSKEININTSNSEEKELFIIDCDAGTDDATALLLALDPNLARRIQILGITCVGGNTTLDNVVKNVLRTLKIAGRTDVPVYKGAYGGLIPREILRPSRSSGFHGNDGLGGAGDTIPISDAEVEEVSKRENAVDWLPRTVLQYPPNKITLVTLGPLTNVAFAHRLYPEFYSRLKRLVIMGGNLNARGNSGLTSEFNFACDVEASHMVLEEFTCPIMVIPFDTCLEHAFTFEYYEGVVSRSNSIKANFVQKIFHDQNDYIKTVYKGSRGFYPCDWLAMVCALNPVDLRMQTVQHYAVVELDGRLTRGQLVIDWRDQLSNVEVDGVVNGKRKIDLVTKMNMDKLKEIFEKMLL